MEELLVTIVAGTVLTITSFISIALICAIFLTIELWLRGRK